MCCQPKLKLKSSCGVVIIMALFIMALVAAMAGAMMARFDRDRLRTSLVIHGIQADFYAQGSIAWAIDFLKKHPEKNDLPIQSPVDHVHGYTVVSRIIDLQGRFNLNTIKNKAAQADFLRLIQAIIPNAVSEKTSEMMDATMDWVMPSNRTTYDDYYLTLKPPYRVLHQPMSDASEWRLVKGVTPELYQTLQPYITALPEAALVNVQTASAPVLVSLIPGMSVSSAKAIEQVRLQSPFKKVEDFLKLDIVNNYQSDIKNKITVISDYFLVETTVSIENQDLVLYTVLHRLIKSDKFSVSIIRQSKGIE